MEFYKDKLVSTVLANISLQHLLQRLYLKIIDRDKLLLLPLTNFTSCPFSFSLFLTLIKLFELIAFDICLISSLSTIYCSRSGFSQLYSQSLANIKLTFTTLNLLIRYLISFQFRFVYIIKSSTDIKVSTYLHWLTYW